MLRKASSCFAREVRSFLQFGSGSLFIISLFSKSTRASMWSSCWLALWFWLEGTYSQRRAWSVCITHGSKETRAGYLTNKWQEKITLFGEFLFCNSQTASKTIHGSSQTLLKMWPLVVTCLGVFSSRSWIWMVQVVDLQTLLRISKWIREKDLFFNLQARATSDRSRQFRRQYKNYTSGWLYNWKPREIPTSHSEDPN